MSDIKISIIIPVYNVGRYLRRCLDSVIGQTLKDIEIVCVNDGSTDESLSILEEYAQIDKRLVIINQENQGPGLARNTGIKFARGQYIGFVDSDDFVSPYYFEYLYKSIVKNDADISFTDNILRFNEDNTVKRYFNLDFDFLEHVYDVLPEVLRANFYNYVVWTKLYKASFLKDNDIKFISKLRHEDLLFYYVVMLKASKIVKNNKSIYYYRNNSLSLTKEKTKVERYDIIRIFEEIYKLLEREKVLGVYELPFSILLFRSSLNSNYKLFRNEVLMMLQRLNISTKTIKELKLRAMLLMPSKFLYSVSKVILDLFLKK